MVLLKCYKMMPRSPGVAVEDLRKIDRRRPANVPCYRPRKFTSTRLAPVILVAAAPAEQLVAREALAQSGIIRVEVPEIVVLGAGRFASCRRLPKVIDGVQAYPDLD